MAQAATIYQENLDVVSKLLWHRDFDGVSAHMMLPKRIETADKITVIETPEDLLATLAIFRASLERLGADAYHRVCIDAEFAEDGASEDADAIRGSHLTYLMRGGQYAIPPYPSDMTLRRVDGRWLGSAIRSEVRNSTCTVISPHLASKPSAAS